MSQIVLYDLPCKGRCACWSLNVWKTRLALNYKGLAYKTEWVEFPDIAPTMKSLHLEPNPEGIPYTVPAVRLPDGTHMMDSRKIAAELDRLHPSPPLHLDAPEISKVEDLVRDLLWSLGPTFLPQAPKDFLNPPSREYSELRFGERFRQMAQEDVEESWAKSKPGMEELGHTLKAKGGPYVLGETVSQADFVILGLLQTLVRVADAEVFKHVVSVEPALGTLYDASTAWFDRDDH